MATIYILALDATRQGGAGVYTWTLIEALASRGHQITLICHEAADELKQLVKVIQLPRVNAQRRFGMWRFSSILQLFDYKKMLKKLVLESPDIVIASAQPMALPYANLFPSHPIVYLPHSLVAPVELASYPYENSIQRLSSIFAFRFMEKHCLKFAKYTVRFTKSAAIAFENYYGASNCKNIITIPMPIKIPLATCKKSAPDPFRLLTIGRLIPSKNFEFLLKILSLLTSYEWKLDIVGAGGEAKSLMEQCKVNGLEGRVTFHGHVEDVASFYQNADLFVFPSKLENSPVVLLEAMSHALPTLSFYPDNKKYLGANHEIICDGKTGLLAVDDIQFSDLLEKILQGTLDISDMGEAALLYVIEKHQWANHIDNFEQIIFQVKNEKH